MGTPTGITLNEVAHPFTFLISEDSDGAGYLSRDEVLIAASQTVVVGQILARQAIPASVTASVAAAAGNAGNGTIALANPAVDANAVGGDYKVIMTGETAFEVYNPDGVIVGKGSAGTAFNKQVKFTLTAGATALEAGDVYTISVNVQPATDDAYVIWEPGKVASAIAGFPVTTTASTTARITVINAHATVRYADLTFGGTNPTQADKDQAMRDLSAKLIKFR